MSTSSRQKKGSSSSYSTRLTSKYQATIPLEIRKHLHLESGDQVLYEVLPDESVVIRKTSSLDLEFFKALNSTMNEWESDQDEQAYKDL